jgi:integrase
VAKLTLRTIEAAELPPKGKERMVWDDELPGFGLRLFGSGKKVFIVRYRVGGRAGTRRRLKLGTYGVLTPDEARRLARHALRLVAEGRDPAAEKIESRAAAARTLEAVAEEWLTDGRGKRRDSTLALYRDLLGRLVLPELGKRPVSALTHAEVARWHARHRETPYQANRSLSVLAALMAWCIRNGERPAALGNPAQGVERFAERSRERFLSEAELAAIGEAIAAEEAKGMNRYAAAALRLLILTGARRDEVRTLRWEWVDLARGQLRLPESKTGAKCIALPPAAVQLLAELPRFGSSPFVFPGPSGKRPLANINRAWDAVREAAGLADVRLHDLRHSFASLGLARGVSLPVLGKLLGHARVSTTERYAHLAKDVVTRAAEDVGGRIGELLGIDPAPAGVGEVVAMPPPAARRRGR